MPYSQPISGNVSDVARANVYSIASVAPQFPLIGDLWADTSYATPPGPQVKQWLGGGWGLYSGAAFSAKAVWGVGGSALALVSATSPVTKTVHVVNANALSVSPASGIEIGFGGTLSTSATNQTTTGQSFITFDVVITQSVPLPGSVAGTIAVTLVRSGMSIGVYGNNPGQAMTGVFSGKIWLPRRDSLGAVVANDIVGLGRVGAAALTGSTSVALIGTRASAGLVDGYYGSGSVAYAGVPIADIAITMTLPALAVAGTLQATLSSIVVSTINEG